MFNWLKKLWHSKQCLLCMQQLYSVQAICPACEHDLPWLLDACCDCALPLPPGDVRCRQCQLQSPAFAQVVAPWRYAFPVNTLISRFKYNASWSYGRLLSQGLVQHLQYMFQEQGLERPDFLVAVPLAKKRLRQRGYNQSQMIAGWLARELGIPSMDKLVRRVRYTQIQQGLSARQRRHNMQQAFAVQDTQVVQGKHVALVDDVLTTGATCEALAQELLAAGARRVDVYCLARTGRVDSGKAE